MALETPLHSDDVEFHSKESDFEWVVWATLYTDLDDVADVSDDSEEDDKVKTAY